MKFSIYDVTTGRIFAHGDCPQEMLQIQGDNCVFGEYDSEMYYVLDRAPVQRETCPVSIDGMVLHNAPVPSVLEINGTAYDVTDNIVDLEFDHPGTYSLVLKCFPYKDGKFEVVV